MSKKYTQKQLKEFLKMVEDKTRISHEEYKAYVAVKNVIINRKRARNPFYVPTMYEGNADVRSLEVFSKVSTK